MGFFPPPVPPQYFSHYRGLWPPPHPSAPTLNYPAGLLPLGAAWSHPHLGPSMPLQPQPYYMDAGKREELAAGKILGLL